VTARLRFPDVLDALAGSRPDDTGIIDDEGVHSWRRLRDEAVSVARSLVALGVRPGDRVAGLLRNRARWLTTAGVSHCACLFQANVPKRADLRVTIGDAVFSVAIYNDHDALDWRKLDSDVLRHEAHPLPAAVEGSLKHLVKMLGLEFGAIEQVLTPNDGYVFLE
jgi:acyl-CoA synthetase (AMP-forming)/AMP-acid ligase II